LDGAKIIWMPNKLSMGRIAEMTICMAISPSLPYGRLQSLFNCPMAGSKAYLTALWQAPELI
jgi:hypothetical protein